MVAVAVATTAVTVTTVVMVTVGTTAAAAAETNRGATESPTAGMSASPCDAPTTAGLSTVAGETCPTPLATAAPGTLIVTGVLPVSAL